jgi:two-component system response regulator HydG
MSVPSATPERSTRVVVVDDEPALARALQSALRRDGVHASAFSVPEEALAAVCDDDVDVVLTDVRMAGLSGLDLLRAVKARRPDVEVVMMSGYATVQAAVEAVKAGAYDYLTKPFEDFDAPLRIVRKAVERKRLLDRNRDLERRLADRGRDFGMVGRSPRIEDLRRMIGTVAQSTSTVLIRGESGTGKELVARALHDFSSRSARPFVAVNCSALSDGLLESELFGHVKGAFTGAVQDRRGLFEAAHRGTLFLDEIGDISPAVQVRLLRVLQEGEVRKVGGQVTERLDVRVIAATNVDLEKAVETGRFRADLYYRLNVISLHVPALRERPEDIPVLAAHFLARFATEMRKNVKRMGAEFLEAIISHPFPGNVRELENLIERAVVLATGEELTHAELPQELRKAPGVQQDPGSLAELSYAEARRVTLRTFERRYFSALLRRFDDNITAAARAAGMDRSNFRRALKASGLRAASLPGQPPARDDP